MTSAIAHLNDFGQSPWYDNVTRVMVREGGLQQLIDEDGIRGVTSNPTIFDKAIGGGEGYDEQLKELHGQGVGAEDAFWALAVDDIGGGADLLRPIYDRLDRGDGFISIEVSPLLAHDTKATIAQAAALFARLARPNILIKIPATLEGIPAIEETIAAGINVNVTLIFSLARHDAVIEAYLKGLERFVAGGGDPSGVSSVASFFVSRVDTETDPRLPDDSPLRGKAAVANAKLAYELFRKRFSGARWDALAAKGAKLQRPLWASTSTKNKAYSPTLYIDSLVGPDTVNTLAPASIDALHQGDANLRANTVAEDVEGARQVMADLKAAGVDFDDVTDTLEREGVDSFAQSYKDLIATLEKRTAEIAA
ncbi:MAG TPA: transaldolase [Acidimicrobiia bacterium]|jgi:transaldolase